MIRPWILVLAFLAAIGVATAAEPIFPSLTGRIVDEAHLLDPAARSALETKLADLESKTNRQLVVVTLNSLQGYEIEDFGYRLGRAWGIGEKEKNNGALLIVAPKERRVRIEVGYGLEGILTDAVSRLIIENAILPRFRVNDYSGGIARGVDDIVQVLSGDVEDFKRRASERDDHGPAGSEGFQELVWVALILGLWLFIMLRSKRRKAGNRNIPWIVPIPMGGTSRYGQWRGGLPSGRSGGGFSGRGGSFGGGGASGRW
jgi:uncharacterized protein